MTRKNRVNELFKALCGFLLVPVLALSATTHAAPDANNEDPQAWYRAAVDARQAADLDAAEDALDHATELGLSPVRAGIERARILVAKDDRDGAVEQLETLAGQGFSAVSLLTGDPLLGTLAGHAGFDALVETMSVSAYPCEHQDAFRQFDFWLGDWVVHTADGTLAGANRIERAERGCVLTEHWSGIGGSSGMSINYFDHAGKEWVQVWTSADGAQIDIRGNLTDEGMLLTGQIHYVSNGTTAPFRGLWTPLPDGRVRQFFEQSDDDGETWTPWFEGFYTRSETSQQD
ncbi:MAG: hypothetical protein WD078_02635 [Woeseia sp.]